MRVNQTILMLMALLAAKPILAGTPLVIDHSRFEANGLDVTWQGDTAVIETRLQDKSDASVAFHAPDQFWDLSDAAAVSFDIANSGSGSAKLEIVLSSKPNDGKLLTNSIEISVDARKSTTARIPLISQTTRAIRAKLFGMQRLPKELHPDKDCIDLTKTVGLTLRFKSLAQSTQVTMSPPQIEVPTSDQQAIASNFFPFIDQFGQYIHRQWPGKLTNEAELKVRAAEEAKTLAANPGPADWDKWGGCTKGPQLDATGAFRTQKVDGKWWLVDPDGRLFFSNGIDCVSGTYTTPYSGRETWFADFPGNKEPLNTFLHEWPTVAERKQGDKVQQEFSFHAANLMRKYGPDWEAISSALDAQRMRAWGINTIGGWSARASYSLDRTPYTIVLDPKAVRIKAYWERFSDPYDPGYVDAVKTSLETAQSTLSDPWCIGYFVNNELAWGTDTSIAQSVLGSPATQAAKQRFVELLKKKYGEIELLNAAWGTHLESWDAMLQKPIWPDLKTAGGDLKDLYRDFCRTYFQRTAQAIHDAAPGRLYLGCRFAWSTPTAQEAATEFCDVVSWNTYTHSVQGYSLPKTFDKPLLIGEFHFGAEDRGLFGCGMQGVANQQERAAAYKGYVASAARNPQIVGAHWFCWRDEPTTGRPGDGENHQIGFIDVTDTPYPETIAASREMGDSIYAIRSGITSK